MEEGGATATLARWLMSYSDKEKGKEKEGGREKKGDETQIIVSHCPYCTTMCSTRTVRSIGYLSTCINSRLLSRQDVFFIPCGPCCTSWSILTGCPWWPRTLLPRRNTGRTAACNQGPSSRGSRARLSHTSLLPSAGLYNHVFLGILLDELLIWLTCQGSADNSKGENQYNDLAGKAHLFSVTSCFSVSLKLWMC